jgi:hypothetical protein
MKIRNWIITGLVFILAGTACSPESKTITVTTAGGKCTLDGGRRVAAGDVTVKWNIQDKTNLLYGLSVLLLDQGKQYKDLADYMSTDTWNQNFPPPFAQWQGDIAPARADSQNEKSILLRDGPIYLVCITGESSVLNNNENVPKVIGILGPVEVMK